MKKSIYALFLLLTLSVIMTACSNHETPIIAPDESSIINQETKLPTADTEPVETTAESSEDHAQGGSYMGDELYSRYIGAAGNLSAAPGDDTFMTLRIEELSKVSKEFLAKKQDEKFSLPPLVYYVIHEMNLTREEVEYYYDHYSDRFNVSDEYIDALFCADVEEAKKLLKSPYAFQIGNNIYNIYDMQELTAQKGTTKEVRDYLTSSVFKAVLENINDYLKEVDPIGTRYDESIHKYVSSYITKDTAE